MSKALTDILNERQRQQEIEGWTPEYDDSRTTGALAAAAACYAEHAGWAVDASNREAPSQAKRLETYEQAKVPENWPWDEESWKPKNPRQDLVISAALIMAEIERLDRGALEIVDERVKVKKGAAYRQCTICGRKSWDLSGHQAICRMGRPDGSFCRGLLRLITPDTLPNTST